MKNFFKRSKKVEEVKKNVDEIEVDTSAVASGTEESEGGRDMTEEEIQKKEHKNDPAGE